jgi:hypothetical protein
MEAIQKFVEEKHNKLIKLEEIDETCKIKDLPEHLRNILKLPDDYASDEEITIKYTPKVKKKTQTEEERKQKIREACLRHYYKNKERLDEIRRQRYYQKKEELKNKTNIE